MKKKIKKRGIKVPSYLTAGTTGMATNNIIPDYAAQLQQQGNAYTRMNNFQLGMLNKDPMAATNFTNSLNKDYPMPEVGAGAKVDQNGLNNMKNSVIAGMGKATDVVNGAVELAGLVTGESTATTGGEAAMQSVAAIGSGMSTGLKIGSSFGPLGGAIGAGVGALVGAIGKKGRYASMTSFTDYDEGTLSTGFRALGGANQRRRREKRRIKANAYDNRDAIRGTSALEADYAQEYGDMGTDTFALGGSTNSLAYVDDGELLRTPDGQISKVPERGKPTDSNLVNIPDGTRILSDSLKVPGTNKTFAQIGEKMIKNKKSKNKDIFAQNAAKLNQLNNEQIYNQLFQLQEQVKAAKGIKPKSKQLIPAADKGLQTYGYNKDLSAFKYWDSKANNYTKEYLDWVNSITESDVKDIYNGKYGDMSTYLGRNRGYIPTVEEARRLMTDHKYGDWHKIGQALVDSKVAGASALANPSRPDLLTGPITDKPISPAKIASSTSQLPTKLEPIPVDYSRYVPKGKSRGNFDWAGLVGSLSVLPGIISDLSAKPEHFDANYNPYATAISNTMRRRRYDVEPELEAIRRNRAVSNYNANQFNTNTGANLAYRLQSAVNADRATAQALTKASNINNQYAGEYANMMNDLGKQWVAATDLAVDRNARSRGAARNINRLGYTGMAQLGQQWAKDYNQRMRDREMLPLYDKFLSAGFTDSDLALLRRNWSKYRR